MLAGQNGILDRAGEAKQLTEEASIKEQVVLLATEYITDYHTGSATSGQTVAEYVATNLNRKQAGGYDITTDGNKVIISNASGQNILIGRVTTGGAVDWSQFWEYATENGKTIITDGTTKLKIGDKIDYDPADGATTTTYTSLAANTGWDNNQIFNVSSLNKNSGENWRVLGVDEEAGQILIIPENFVGPTEGGATAAGDLTYYYLKGQAGYVNGISELNKISDLYGHGKYGAGARTITVDDVNKITEYNPITAKYGEGQTFEYGNEMTYTRNGPGSISYSGTNGVTGTSSVSTFNYFDESTKTWKEFGSTATGSIQLTSTYYYYKILGIDDATKQLLVGTQSGKYYFTGNGAKMKYWLGSSYVDARSDCAYFGLRGVYSGRVDFDSLYYSDDSSHSNYLGVRPVVSLQSNINLKYNTTSEEWEFSK